ncbi:hypothetical protein H920_01234 [Fukomys damarensis]|uniref:Uncharacterized protein n=1 Tax=Fukomys damarensis TaxID=885580 RepID=A0A091E1Z3_FUKDA|nr:hypothetical protein H920_01234 [Fukomys damarensis]
MSYHIICSGSVHKTPSLKKVIYCAILGTKNFDCHHVWEGSLTMNLFLIIAVLLIQKPTGDLICPVQGRWGPEGKKRWPDLQQLLRDDPQQIHKLGISVAWAEDNGFEESAAHENQCRGKECPKDKTKQTKQNKKTKQNKTGGLVKLLNTFQSFHLNDEEIQKEDNKNHEKLQRKKKDFLELNYGGRPQAEQLSLHPANSGS